MSTAAGGRLQSASPRGWPRAGVSAIRELGKGLQMGDPDFGAYARRMKDRGKPGGVILCGLGHRANRLAFAMMRDQVRSRKVAKGADGALMPEINRPPSK